jgi:hypothetical protein
VISSVVLVLAELVPDKFSMGKLSNPKQTFYKKKGKPIVLFNSYLILDGI